MRRTSRVQILEPIVANHAQTYTAKALRFERRPVVGDHRVEQGQIRHGARMGADLIEQRRDRYAAPRRVASGRRSEAGNAAERGRHPDGSFGILRNPEGRKPCGDRGSGSAAAPAGYALEVVGIVNRAERKIVAGPTVRQLMQIGLAEHDGACVPERRDDRCILGRAKMPQSGGAAGSRIILGIDAIFDRDGQAEQGSQPCARAALPVACTSSFQYALRLERDEGVECALRSAAGEQRGRITLRAERAVRHVPYGIGRTQIGERRRGGGRVQGAATRNGDGGGCRTEDKRAAR